MTTTNDAMFEALAGSYPSAGQTLGDLLYAFWSDKGLQYRGSLQYDYYVSEGTKGNVISRSNLVPNPNFESGTPNWGGSNLQSILTTSTTQKYIGTQSLRLERTTSTGNLGCALPENQVDTLANGVKVVAGRTYTVSAYVYQTTAGTVDINMNYMSGISTSVFSIENPFNPPVNTWSRISYTVTAPVGADSLRIVIRFLNRPIGEFAYVDAVLVEEQTSVLPYFDGAYVNVYDDYALTTQSWSGTVNASTSTATWDGEATLGDLANNYFSVVYDTVTFDTDDFEEWLELEIFDRYDTVEQTLFSL